MRYVVGLLISLSLIGCRTTKEENERFFAEADSSNDGLAGVTVKQKPAPKPSEPLPSKLPEAPDPLEQGAFYRLCVARNQLASEQALTIQAMLAAVHQQTCPEAERWLRDRRHASLMIESEELVELQSLTVLQNYPHIRSVYIKVAKGVNPQCPLPLPQVCHFRIAEF